MKKKMVYPDKEPMVIVRTCLKAICCKSSPAAKLLAVLLYWYDKSDCENTHFTVYRTQDQLVTDDCEEFTVRTLHDIAAPRLEALGYIETSISLNGKVYYSVCIDQVNEALEAYKKDTLNILLQKTIDNKIEKFLIPIPQEEIEKFPKEIEKLLIILEKFLFKNRKIAISTRGRKPSTEAALRAKPKPLESKRLRESKRKASLDAPTHLPTSLNGRNGHTPPKQESLHFEGLTLEEQAVCDEWQKMPWFKGIPQKVTPSVPESCRKLIPFNPTLETMLKVKNWATSAKVDTQGWYKGKSWSLAFLATEYPKWLSTQLDTSEQQPPTPPERPRTGRLNMTQQRLQEQRLAQTGGN